MVELNSVERTLVQNVEEYGWHCMNVGAGDGEPNFSYSIGFSKTLGCPEILIFGLKNDVMHGMLWGMFEAFQSGRIAEPTSKWSEPLPGYECELRFLSPSQKDKGHFGSALWYWHKYLGNSSPLARAQLFWPGVIDRLLPWEEGVHRDVIDCQPRLDLPASTA